MQKWPIYAVLAVLMGLLLASGCNEPVVTTTPDSVSLQGVKSFPAPLVGRWKDKDSGWEIVFAPDGTISEAVISPLGWVRIEPGRTNEIPMREGGTGVFEPGTWFVDYFADERRLNVEISFEKIHLEIGETVLAGSSRDIIEGTVSEDFKVWMAEWFNIPQYSIISADGQQQPLPVDPEDTRRRLTFEKVDE